MSENKLAIMPLEHYQNACDKIKEKTNTEDLIKSGELTEKIVRVFEVGKNAEWNEIKGTSSGEIIGINDISPIEHEMGVKIRGKNLIDYTKAVARNSAQTVAIDEETNSVIWSGDYYFKIPLGFTIKAGTKFAFTCTSSKFLRLGYANSSTDVMGVAIPASQYDIYGRFSVTDTAPIDFDVLYIYKQSVTTFENDIVFTDIQLELGTTATSYAPYIPDISAVKAMKLGKNLCDNVYEIGGIDSGTGNNFINDSYIRSVNYNSIKPNTTYTIKSFDSTPNIRFRFYDKDKNYIGYIFSVVSSGNAFTFTTNAESYFVRFDVANTGINLDTKLQLELGSTATEYEPYIQPTEYTPDADGVVLGVTSLYPSTTLMTDTDGATIEATYNRILSEVENIPERIEAIYDEGCIKGNRELWDLLTNNNTRTDFNKIFYGSGFEYVRPPYQIQPTGNYAINQTFAQSKNLKKVEAKYFDFSKKPRGTTNVYGVYHTFNACSNLEEIEDLGIQPEFSLVLTYSWCTKLRKIAIVRVDENTKYDETFNYCYALEEVRFEGIIGQNGLNFQWSTKLSKASWQSIIGCLSTTTSGLSITGSLDSIKKAFETNTGANDGDISTEWLELETSRSNWKINLL